MNEVIQFDIQLLIAVIAGIAILLELILHLKIPAFIALLISSIAVGIFAGMNPNIIIENVIKGMGSTLGFVATVVGLGAMMGAILESSGGAQAMAFMLCKKPLVNHYYYMPFRCLAVLPLHILSSHLHLDRLQWPIY